MPDILFSTVEVFNTGRDWGRFLDAGTGVSSLQWIQTLSTTSWTAITADNQMLRSIKAETSIKIRPFDSLVVGNWMDSNFCSTLGKFDTILADYLIGAVDGFSPFEQDTIIKKLADHLNPQGRLYFIGMNPIPDSAIPPADIVTDVRRARDACILLAGHRPYREFPLTWTNRHLEQANFSILNSKSFTIMHSQESIIRQIKVGRNKIYLMHADLRSGMERYLDDLESVVLTRVSSAAEGRIPCSFDYVISAELALSQPPSVQGDGVAVSAELTECPSTK